MNLYDKIRAQERARNEAFARDEAYLASFLPLTDVSIEAEVVVFKSRGKYDAKHLRVDRVRKSHVRAIEYVGSHLQVYCDGSRALRFFVDSPMWESKVRHLVDEFPNLLRLPGRGAFRLVDKSCVTEVQKSYFTEVQESGVQHRLTGTLNFVVNGHVGHSYVLSLDSYVGYGEWDAFEESIYR